MAWDDGDHHRDSAVRVRLCSFECRAKNKILRLIGGFYVCFRIFAYSETLLFSQMPSTPLIRGRDMAFFCCYLKRRMSSFVIPEWSKSGVMDLTIQTIGDYCGTHGEERRFYDSLLRKEVFALCIG